MANHYKFPQYIDDTHRGILTVFELNEIPFVTKRVFTVLSSEAGVTRGKHAHKVCNQLICCLSGSVRVFCDDGLKKEEIEINPLSGAILVPAGVWSEQKYLQNLSMIAVFCDQSFNEADYIRDYDEFLCWKGLSR